MPWWAWALVALVAVAVIALIAWSVMRGRRSQRLQERFGPEYDRTLRTAGDRRGAESELESRLEHRSGLTIRPLAPAARGRYVEAWRGAQGRFVDSPSDAVREADQLVIVVMRERGYPVDDFETRAGDVSVDHPQVVENYRAAHAISQASERGDAQTEDLRQAMVHYRTLFEWLLGAPDEQLRVAPADDRRRETA
jgi:hypothetical protein